VGELGGLALVKNAVTQARRAVERMAERRHAGPAAGAGVFDLIVVGAGPAGLTAAATARERGLSCVVLEQEDDLGGTVLHYPRRKLVLVQPIEIPLWGRTTKEEYSKEELLAIFRELVDRAALDIRFGHRVAAVRQEPEGFSVEAGSGVCVHGRSVALALGRRGTPRKLGVPGEEMEKVMYQLVDAESYQGQRLLVVGGGDSAVEAAIGLARQAGNEVTLSYRREKLVRVKKKNEERFQALSSEGRLRPLFASGVQEILPGRVRLSTSGQAETRVDLPNDYVFVFAGGEPPFDLVRRMGVRFGGE